MQEDDETTLAEQEKFEGSQGLGQAQELDGLAKEADVPLDQLLKMYGVAISDDCQIKPIDEPLGEPPSQQEAGTNAVELKVSRCLDIFLRHCTVLL